MRNYSFVGSNSFAINPGWSKETLKLVRSTAINSIYTLFQTALQNRKLSLTTTSERRVLVAFRHWFLLVSRHQTNRPFVYVNVNTGKSLVLTVDTSKSSLVDPRFLPWEDLMIKFVDYK